MMETSSLPRAISSMRKVFLAKVAHFIRPLPSCFVIDCVAIEKAPQWGLARMARAKTALALKQYSEVIEDTLYAHSLSSLLFALVLTP
jgi:hypothetical protein